MSDKKTIQSPLAKARGLGSAKDGTTHWFHERLTSLAGLPLTLWLVWSFLQMPGWSYEEFTGWLAAPVNAVLMILTIIVMFYHAALGAQVIVEDYIHNEWFKTFKLIGIKLFFIVAGVACVFAVLKIAL